MKNASNRLYFIRSQLHEIGFGYCGTWTKSFLVGHQLDQSCCCCETVTVHIEFSQLTVQYVTPYFTVTYPGIHHLFCTSSAIAPPLLLPFYPQALPVQFETLESEICFHGQVSVKHIILHP